METQRGLPSYLVAKFCGAHSGEPELLRMAEEFIRQSNAAPSEMMSSRAGVISYPKTGVSARHAKDGSGALWIKIFSKYEGDACLLFPFRTAARPRGTVTYNFKSMEAHRAMCTTVHKLPPEGKPMALHRCGNGHLGCVTPSHLYWGDASDNAKDAAQHRAQGKPEAVLDRELMRRPRRRRRAA